ncbi:hypothetical protein H7U19_00175 [Hyunsoonleella sp. SJ7]|uniref:Alpha-L-glutamate ligase-related protein ATP-grasp domain-containing protein n=1 Tax=Hyunsoonleella aquatilis TaxID=2762758 RepID=A0A923KKG6_9FLAO|nr:hypothetical protein [Hyunsoonleella aquatilis]
MAQNRLKVFLKSPLKKHPLKIIKEVLILMVVKREIPYYYFKYLYRRDVPNYLDYMGLKERMTFRFHKSMHNIDYENLIDDKLYFALFSERANMRTPKLLSYNFRSSFFFENKVLKINDLDSADDFFQNILAKENIAGVFFRPISDWGGKGCFRVTKANSRQVLGENYEKLVKGNFVHNEVVHQHEAINEIHSNSINTLRIVTLIVDDGSIEIIVAAMRFGIGDNIVDNASSGGFFVGMDIAKGILNKYGYYLAKFGGEKITEHPDSHYEFDGFKVPFYDEVLSLVKETVRLIPNKLIGFDIAITPSGPVIIEANATPAMDIADVAHGGLLKNKHVKKVLKDLM